MSQNDVCPCGKYKAYRKGLCWGCDAELRRHERDFAEAAKAAAEFAVTPEEKAALFAEMLDVSDRRASTVSNAEQYEMLCTVLCKLVDVLDCDELSLLEHCCGVQIADFYQPDEQPRIAA